MVSRDASRAPTFERIASASLLAATLGGCALPGTACEDDFNLGLVIVDTPEDIAALPRARTILELRVIDTQLEDLAGFECLTEVGNLRIEDNARLRSLDGLDALARVGQIGRGDFFGGWDLNIVDNPLLGNLVGLAALEEVGGSLTIERNDALVRIEDLAALHSVLFTLKIADNAALERVSGFAAYEGWSSEGDYGGGLTVRSNPRLHTLEFDRAVHVQHLNLAGNAELSNVALTLLEQPRGYDVSDNDALTALPPWGTGVAGFHACQCYRIANNAMLSSLDSLKGLEGVEELSIAGNAQLTNLHGLEQLSVGLLVAITGNPRLVSLDAIDPMRDGVMTIAQELVIEDNSDLPTCEAKALAATLADLNEGFISDIDGNAPPNTCR